MKVVRVIQEVRSAVLAERRNDRRIGFVPTMGALHEGHLALVDIARAETDVVVMSIFVNPLQFGPNEDLATYPRNEERDLTLARDRGVDIVFLPSVEEMYPPGRSTTVSIGELATAVEGTNRPGHFDGVATVVAKLFNIVPADVAFFGQKDAQQVAVIKKMVADLSFAIEIRVCPTVREGDGLAMSSRNAYLSPEERERSTALIQALNAGARALEETGDPHAAGKVMTDLLETAEGVELDYAIVLDPETFGPPVPGEAQLLAVAARVGSTRLIDNVLVTSQALEG